MKRLIKKNYKAEKKSETTLANTFDDVKLRVQV